MSVKTFWVLIIVAVGIPGVNWAGETKLVLLKKIEDIGTHIRKGYTCKDTFFIDKDQDYSDLREMKNDFCHGEYSFTLDGPPGTTVTLYGQYYYGEARGTLTLTKTDHRRVWIWDLDDFPDGRWVVTEANKDTGAYELFYSASSNFQKNLGSVKWNELP